LPAQTSRLAVDLSGSLLRVADGALGESLRCGSGGTPAGALVDGKVVDASGVSGALRQLLARVEIRETRALVAVSDSLATFRVLRLPPGATDEIVEATISRELPVNPGRMLSRWMEIHTNGAGRTVYAVVWDRDLVNRAADAVQGAGLEPVVVELKSLCIARVVAEPACVLVDMSGNPMEIFVINDHVPELWHTFHLATPVAEDIVDQLADPLRQVLRFYTRRRDSGLNPRSPIMISSDQVVSDRTLLRLSQILRRPVQLVSTPSRVPQDVRHGIYLTCLGLLMRRGT